MVMMAGRAAETTLLGFHHDDKGNRQDKRDIKRLAKVLPARSHDEILEELESEGHAELDSAGCRSPQAIQVAEPESH